MKKISLLLLLIITACNSSDTESIEIGSKETEYLNIENPLFQSNEKFSKINSS